MKKIPTLYARDWQGDRSRVINEVNPECAWVLDGQGRATRKWDGTAILMRAGRAFKRYDAKAGRTPPVEFEPAQDADPKTGHWPGWLPASDGPADRWLREALGPRADLVYDGTYELIGPKVQGNPERWPEHALVRHGSAHLTIADARFETVRHYLEINAIEGIVWHHDDGRMAKITRRDFGIPWPPK